ncbi:hypothetical protein ROJ8625_01631 [Roseivivax jejudonensis]|uniref:Lysophospholipase n=1 Tax=Roseivivax jejudonensis TaxID=1529041 RepID=A0A1X6Z019_9RHOB|nr:DUF1489 domain-containing protein [Roseivivax jejudonensis]SLN36350.1 hypothetical protein ROJ8625_01631 [Roseivivax jejudonensis]
MTDVVHLVKLSAGTESVEQLQRWQASRAAQGPDGHPRHVTRMWPKREQAILAGGSIFWVIKGLIQCRQRILRLDEVTGQDGIRRCAIVLEPEIVRVTPAPRRPFQGWRYLAAQDAPADLRSARADDDALPPELAGALAEIGVI